jgi:predicted O-linked N-acetylglucosamine transferase (SPINDLY family)
MPSLLEAMEMAAAAHQAGQLARAEQIYRAILQAYPEHAETQNMLGVVLFQQGHADQAIPWLESSVRLEPNQAPLWSNVGMVLGTMGQREQALDAFRRAVQIDPQHVGSLFNLAAILSQLGRLAEATEAFRRVVALKPDMVAAHRALGALLEHQLQWQEAVSCYRQVLRLEPNQIETLRNLGSTLHSLGRLDEAEQALCQAISLQPNRAEVVARLAVVQQAQGRIEEALTTHRRAMALEPSTPWIHSAYLMCLQYCPGVTPDQLAREHAEWDRRHAAPLRSQWRAHAVDRDPQRPLRLGFVSIDFGFHTVGVLLIRALEGLRHQSCEIFCYSDRPADPFTSRFQQAAHHWRQTESLSDEALAEQIRHDRIDVLFELSGHTPRNRLLALARKPAPIQVTWLGYVGTTGLEAIDYLVADPRQVPPESDRYYRERVLRLPDDYATYEPFPAAPAVGPLPAERNGWIMFGSLNNPAKFNPEIVALWARILRQVPDAHLTLRYGGLVEQTRERFVRQFAEHGIAADRLHLLSGGTNLEIYAQYNEIDVGLDPHPYSGGLTTIEALWMGVPVVTLPGATFASRHSLAHLTAVGLTDTIARDPEHYVELAVELAYDWPRLAALRAGLRHRVAESPLCDGRRAAEHLMEQLRQAWLDWLARSG